MAEIKMTCKNCKYGKAIHLLDYLGIRDKEPLFYECVRHPHPGFFSSTSRVIRKHSDLCFEWEPKE